MQFSLSINQGRLLVFKCEGFIIEDSVQVIDATKGFGDVVLNSPYLGSILDTLLAFQLNRCCKFVNLT